MCDFWTTDRSVMALCDFVDEQASELAMLRDENSTLQDLLSKSHREKKMEANKRKLLELELAEKRLDLQLKNNQIRLNINAILRLQSRSVKYF